MALVKWTPLKEIEDLRRDIGGALIPTYVEKIP